ncbi:DUF6361 family protein, partial [Georgenia sp. 10Sc9-8]|nr:DUF6361 family protein [Georgenia halotolerans]
ARLRYLDLLFRRKAEQTGATPPNRPALDDLLSAWLQEMDAESARVARWVDRLPDLFDLLTDHGVRTQRPARAFVTAWCQHAVADPEGALASTRLGDTITAREASLKKGAARLTNASPLASWNGELLGSDRLNFRWPVAQQHVTDCTTAMEDAHAGS